MITASYAFLPHIRVSVVIIFKSVGYITLLTPFFVSVPPLFRQSPIV
ncbi:hypothetical protein [Symbiopectobacterium sp. RP]